MGGELGQGSSVISLRVFRQSVLELRLGVGDCKIAPFCRWLMVSNEFRQRARIFEYAHDDMAIPAQRFRRD